MTFAITFHPARPASPTLRLLACALAASLGAGLAQAQSSAAANNTPLIYPAKGQSAEQQDKDKYECHGWARGQSGYDPTQAVQTAAAAPTQTAQQTQQAKGSGSAAGSMAAGAMGGAAVAELTKGDAGKGAAAGALGGAMLQRVKQQQAQSQQMQQQAANHAAQQQQAAQQQVRGQQRSTYERALAACMEGRGYTVK